MSVDRPGGEKGDQSTNTARPSIYHTEDIDMAPGCVCHPAGFGFRFGSRRLVRRLVGKTDPQTIPRGARVEPSTLCKSPTLLTSPLILPGRGLAGSLRTRARLICAQAPEVPGPRGQRHASALLSSIETSTE